MFKTNMVRSSNFKKLKIPKTGGVKKIQDVVFPVSKNYWNFEKLTQHEKIFFFVRFYE